MSLLASLSPSFLPLLTLLTSYSMIGSKISSSDSSSISSSKQLDRSRFCLKERGLIFADFCQACLLVLLLLLAAEAVLCGEEVCSGAAAASDPDCIIMTTSFLRYIGQTYSRMMHRRTYRQSLETRRQIPDFSLSF